MEMGLEEAGFSGFIVSAVVCEHVTFTTSKLKPSLIVIEHGLKLI